MLYFIRLILHSNQGINGMKEKRLNENIQRSDT